MNDLTSTSLSHRKAIVNWKCFKTELSSNEKEEDTNPLVTRSFRVNDYQSMVPYMTLRIKGLHSYQIWQLQYVSMTYMSNGMKICSWHNAVSLAVAYCGWRCHSKECVKSCQCRHFRNYFNEFLNKQIHLVGIRYYTTKIIKALTFRPLSEESWYQSRFSFISVVQYEICNNEVLWCIVKKYKLLWRFIGDDEAASTCCWRCSAAELIKSSTSSSGSVGRGGLLLSTSHSNTNILKTVIFKLWNKLLA